MVATPRALRPHALPPSEASATRRARGHRDRPHLRAASRRHPRTTTPPRPTDFDKKEGEGGDAAAAAPAEGAAEGDAAEGDDAKAADAAAEGDADAAEGDGDAAEGDAEGDK